MSKRIRTCCVLRILRLLAVATVLPAAAEIVPIRILHTTDLHGHIEPATDYDGTPDQGGIARCATAIRRLRSEIPDTILLDNGDTLQGTPVSFLTGGEVMVRILEELRYDAWNWGNHEFDWGWQRLLKTAGNASVPILNANLDLSDSIWPAEWADRIRPYLLKDFDGVRVAVVGLNTPGIPNWSRPRLLGGVRIEDPLETLERVLPRVRAEGADIIVVLAHQGYRSWGDDPANRIRSIADRFPEIDLVIGGHTHQDQPEVRLDGVVYTQAAYWGTRLGVADLLFNTGTRKVVSIACRTLPMGPGISLDGDVLRRTAADRERARRYMEEPVGRAAEPIGTAGWPQRPCALFDLIGSALSEASGCRIVVHGLLDPGQSLEEGTIRMRDVWRIMPYENTLGVATVTGDELRRIVAEQVRWIDSPRFNAPWGLRCEIWRDGEEIRRVALRGIDGAPIDPSARYRVAFHSYALAGGGTRFPELRAIADEPDSRLEEGDRLTRDLLADYIRKRRIVRPHRPRAAWVVHDMAGERPVPR